MTRPRGELTTYRARGGHATDWANPTRYMEVDRIHEEHIYFLKPFFYTYRYVIDIQICPMLSLIVLN